ncbi:MAG: outer membrane lipoprotein-sorting protein [Gammaproteobacteria bacterium]|nr:outer membrane lipoprotein-sorting protein [Gammaproteobacteria bacterium]MDH3857303.1 outer membrane lipoprotein-sorting protein [Gammaproteobacteria bacterium]
MAIKNLKLSVYFRLYILLLFALSGVWSTLAATESDTPDPRDLIRAAMEHWRGITSYSEMTMTVHRSDWERSFSMQAWTEGDKLSLVRVTAPKRDAGNGTLVKDQSMWTFSPKINRILKVPSSMMNQSWMGSDFSNKDISKSTDIIDQYDHRLLKTETRDDHLVYTIESIPHEEAAVVWGKEIVTIRDDFILLRQEFWDQDDILVKEMNATEIAVMDDRTIASRMRMHKLETPDEWTEMVVDDIDFDIALEANLFTLSSLRNPRQ